MCMAGFAKTYLTKNGIEIIVKNIYAGTRIVVPKLIFAVPKGIGQAVSTLLQPAKMFLYVFLRILF